MHNLIKQLEKNLLKAVYQIVTNPIAMSKVFYGTKDFLSGIFITRCSLNSDRRIARLYLISLNEEDEHQVLKILTDNADYIRRKVNEICGKGFRVPALRFEIDVSLKHLNSLEKMFNKEK